MVSVALPTFRVTSMVAVCAVHGHGVCAGIQRLDVVKPGFICGGAQRDLGIVIDDMHAGLPDDSAFFIRHPPGD
jgi:hypothetical protein